MKLNKETKRTIAKVFYIMNAVVIVAAIGLIFYLIPPIGITVACLLGALALIIGVNKLYEKMAEWLSLTNEN